MSVLDTVILNGAEYSLAGSDGGVGKYKTPEMYVTTLTPVATLENTRVMGGTASTTSGYTTYLFSFADMESAGYEALVSTFDTGATYYGYYTQSGSSYTYENTVNVSPYCPVVNSNYTGFFISTNKEMEFTYYYAVGISTNDGYAHDTQKGFRSLSKPYLSFKSGSSGYIHLTGLPSDSAYIVDVGSANPTGFFQKTTSSVVGTYLKLTADTNQYLIANVKKAPFRFEFRPNQQSANLRALCQRGVWLWELTDIAEVIEARSNVSKVVIVHAGNLLDNVIFALAQGWSGVECDVRTTSDGIAILSHEASIKGLAISSSTYAELLEAQPNVTTVDELLSLIGKFKGWVNFHWQAVDDSVKLRHIQLAYGYGVPFIMYYSGSNGTYIGDSIAIADFWKTGIAYVSGLSSHDTTHPNIKNDLGNGLSWRATALGSGVELNHTKLIDGTYDAYNFITAYFYKSCLYQ